MRSALARFLFTFVTIPTRRTRTAFRLHVAFRLFEQNPAGKTHLVGLRVDFEQFDFDLVTELEYVFNLFRLVPVYFGYMEKAFLARQDLDESSEVKYGFYSAFVNLAHFRDSNYALDPFESGLHRMLVIAEYVYDALCLASFFRLFSNGDYRACFLLDLLYHLSAFAYDGAYELARNPYLYDTRDMRLVVRPRLADAFEHFAHDMHPSTARCSNAFSSTS